MDFPEVYSECVVYVTGAVKPPGIFHTCTPSPPTFEGDDLV